MFTDPRTEVSNENERRVDFKNPLLLFSFLFKVTKIGIQVDSGIMET